MEPVLTHRHMVAECLSLPLRFHHNGRRSKALLLVSSDRWACLPRGHTATHSWTWDSNPVPQAWVFAEGQLSVWHQAQVGLEVGGHLSTPFSRPWGWLSGVVSEHPFSHPASHPSAGPAENSPPVCRDNALGVLEASLSHIPPCLTVLRLALYFLSPLRGSLAS